MWLKEETPKIDNDEIDFFCPRAQDIVWALLLFLRHIALLLISKMEIGADF